MSLPAKLLANIEELGTPMGLVYERAVAYERPLGARPRHAIFCPRGASRVTVSFGKAAKEFRLDVTQVLWIPAGLKHQIEGRSSIHDALTLLPDEASFGQIFADNGLSAGDRRTLETAPLLLKRTRWLDDILDRYFFERVLNRNSPPGCTFFLEKQILNELARIVFREKLDTWTTQEDQKEGFEAALRYIETNLFQKIDLEQVAASARISKSALLRVFKKETKQAPYSYIKDRRLDEALALLKAGEHPVGDVALLVGYDDLAAFTRAFRQKFGKAPSQSRGVRT